MRVLVNQMFVLLCDFQVAKLNVPFHLPFLPVLGVLLNQSNPFHPTLDYRRLNMAEQNHVDKQISRSWQSDSHNQSCG